MPVAKRKRCVFEQGMGPIQQVFSDVDIFPVILKYIESSPFHLLLIARILKSYTQSILHEKDSVWVSYLTNIENEHRSRNKDRYRVRAWVPFVRLLDKAQTPSGISILNHPLNALQLTCIEDSRIFDVRGELLRERFFEVVPRQDSACAYLPGLVSLAQEYCWLNNTSRCGICKCKHHHHVVWKLHKRVCLLCMRDNLISNSELFLNYGVNFHDLYDELYNGNIYAFETSKAVSHVFRMIHQRYMLKVKIEHMRFWKPQYLTPREHVFLWKPHVQKFVDLSVSARLMQEKIDAMAAISACVKRTNIFLIGVLRNSVSRGLHEFQRKAAARCARPFSHNQIMRNIGLVMRGCKYEEPYHFNFIDRFYSRFTVPLSFHNVKYQYRLTYALTNHAHGKEKGSICADVPSLRTMKDAEKEQNLRRMLNGIVVSNK